MCYIPFSNFCIREKKNIIIVNLIIIPIFTLCIFGLLYYDSCEIPTCNYNGELLCYNPINDKYISSNMTNMNNCKQFNSINCYGIWVCKYNELQIDKIKVDKKYLYNKTYYDIPGGSSSNIVCMIFAIITGIMIGFNLILFCIDNEYKPRVNVELV